jgi:hypothetical protein
MLRLLDNERFSNMITSGAPDRAALPGDRRNRRCKSGVSGSRARTLSSTVPGVTEPDATGPSPATRHAGQVVRRVLLRRNIVIDAETAQLVAAAVQAALRAGAPSRPPRRGTRAPAADGEPLF